MKVLIDRIYFSVNSSIVVSKCINFSPKIFTFFSQTNGISLDYANLKLDVSQIFTNLLIMSLESIFKFLNFDLVSSLEFLDEIQIKFFLSTFLDSKNRFHSVDSSV